MAKLFAWLSAASRVKSRRAVLSMTHRLTWPYSLDDWAMSRLGDHCLADGRMEDGGWFISPPWHSGGESDRSFAGKAPALFLAVRAPAGWQRPPSLCHAGPASGVGPRRPVRCVGAFWSGWFWGVCSVLRSRRDLLPGSDPAIFNLRGTAAFRRQGDRSGLTRAQCPSEAQSNKLCDPSMGEQNLLSKAASFRGQWFTY
jgi:hypothetical protein